MAKKKEKVEETAEVTFDGLGVVVTKENNRYVLRTVKYDSATGQTEELSKDVLTDSKLSTMLKAEVKLQQLLQKELK